MQVAGRRNSAQHGLDLSKHTWRKSVAADAPKPRRASDTRAATVPNISQHRGAGVRRRLPGPHRRSLALSLSLSRSLARSLSLSLSPSLCASLSLIFLTLTLSLSLALSVPLSLCLDCLFKRTCPTRPQTSTCNVSERTGQKASNYLKWLHKDLEEMPGDPRTIYYLGTQFTCLFSYWWYKSTNTDAAAPQVTPTLTSSAPPLKVLKKNPCTTQAS